MPIFGKKDKQGNLSVNLMSVDGIPQIPQGMAIRLTLDDNNNRLIIELRIGNKPPVYLDYNQIVNAGLVTDRDVIEKNNINIENLIDIYEDYIEYKNSYDNQAEFIANILRSESMVHSVKSRIKEPERLIEKIIRKTEDRKLKYGDDFQFTVDNYKNEINDLIGIRNFHFYFDV